MPTQASPIMSFLPVIVVCVILYMMVIRPQQKQAKELRRMLDALKSGDRVLTQGGLYGSVMNMKGDIVVLKIAEGVKVEVSRSSITQVILETSNGAPISPKEVVS